MTGGASRRWGAVLALALVALGALTVWRAGTDPSGTAHEFVGATMGTSFSVTVDADMSAKEHERVRSSIEGRLDRVNRLMSTYDPSSELSRFNQHVSTEPFPVSRELLEVLTTAHEVSERSAGAFDVTVAPFVDAWGFGPDEMPITTPSAPQLAAIRERVGYQLIVLDEQRSSVSKTHPEVVADLSGIAKGYAAESVSAGLVELGYARFLVEVGGELRALGTRREGRPWRVGIETPDADLGSIHGTVELTDEAVATSGDYRNYYEADGVRYSHIIDPRTGSPVRFRRASVSVVHEDGAAADAWATALIVLGPDAGYEVARREGIAALFVIRSGDGFESLVTPAMAGRFTTLEGGDP